jgi:hypothetical protein
MLVGFRQLSLAEMPGLLTLWSTRLCHVSESWSVAFPGGPPLPKYYGHGFGAGPDRPGDRPSWSASWPNWSTRPGRCSHERRNRPLPPGPRSGPASVHSPGVSVRLLRSYAVPTYGVMASCLAPVEDSRLLCPERGREGSAWGSVTSPRCWCTGPISGTAASAASAGCPDEKMLPTARPSVVKVRAEDQIPC